MIYFIAIYRDKNVLNAIEIQVLDQITPRNLWMEEQFLFEQIKSTYSSEYFHEISKYRLAWVPPYSSTMTYIPLNDIELQESIYNYFSSHRLKNFHLQVVFFLITSHPSIPIFAPRVHPASLVSYRTKLEIFNKLCQQYSEGLIPLDDLHSLLLHGVNVWKKVVYRNLPEDERVYHEYLNETVASGPKVTESNVERLFVEGEVPFDVFHDLKFAERAKVREQESQTYPRPYSESPCIVCSSDKGVIQCSSCENKVCTECILRLYGDSSTKTDSNVLTLHRYHCQKRSRVAEITAYVVPPPAYLIQLRLTGREAALAQLPPDESISEENEIVSSDEEEESISEGESETESEPRPEHETISGGERRLQKLDEWLKRRVQMFGKLKRKIEKHRSRSEDRRRNKGFRIREKALLEKYQARVTKYIDRHRFALSKLNSYDEETKILPSWSNLQIQLAVFRDDLRIYEDGGLAASGGPMSYRSIAESRRQPTLSLKSTTSRKIEDQVALHT